MALRISTPRIICGSVAIAIGAYTVAAYRSISTVPQRSMKCSLTVSDAFNTSHTYTKLINPKDHGFAKDSRSISLRLPKDKAASYSDEMLLSAALKGFFGGWVFSPERIALGLLNVGVGPFPGVSPAAPSSVISKVSQLSSTHIARPSTTFFSAFQVVHSNLADGSKSLSESTVDVAFGSPTSGFSGCHRLRLNRQPTEDGEDETINIALECVAGNPSQDKRVGPGVVMVFHRAYANLLFRDAVAEVKRQTLAQVSS